MQHQIKKLLFLQLSSANSSSSLPKYSSSSGLTIQPTMKLPNSGSSANVSVNNDKKSNSSSNKISDMSYLKSIEGKISNTKTSQSPLPSSIFANPLSLASNMEKNDRATPTSSHNSVTNSIPPSIPSSILRLVYILNLPQFLSEKILRDMRDTLRNHLKILIHFVMSSVHDKEIIS